MLKKWMYTLVLTVLGASLAYAADNRPPGVPAQYDDDDNPTYYYALGDSGNVLYYEGEGENRKPVYGWMDFATYRGWRTYHAECHVCHGPDAAGSTFAPALKDSLDYLDWEKFSDLIVNGKTEAQGAQVGNAMPAFGNNPNVMRDLENLYRYVRMRHEGKLRRGPRPPKLAKVEEVDE
ncbi:MAG: c-type cytochrome [Alphaproteobacteria bacterium GM202ARS2]|nr:c-type cytochrome [Alphaproteobacteria bacterium GM202ARS2]